jgi:hypothetical protein
MPSAWFFATDFEDFKDEGKTRSILDFCILSVLSSKSAAKERFNEVENLLQKYSTKLKTNL